MNGCGQYSESDIRNAISGPQSQVAGLSGSTGEKNWEYLFNQKLG